MDGFAGVTAIDTSVGGVTVRLAEPVVVPEAAWIVVPPAATPVANPAPVIVATPVLLDVQVTEVVRFCWFPSLYVPVAVNCCVPPFAIEGAVGVTDIDVRVAPLKL